MGVTGVIYPAYLPPYSTVFWHLLAVARSGSNRADDDDVAWESARRRKKKPKWTTLLIIDFGCSQEYLQCGRGVQRVLSLQVYQWHQTALGSRYSRSTILHPLH